MDKSEIEKTLGAMGQVKANSRQVMSKPYFPKRMYKVMMTHFYMVCTILKDEPTIRPPFTKREIRDVMKSPLSFWDVCKMKTWCLRNLALYVLGVLPPSLSVALMRMAGKRKGLI